jgi:hypothetical protein
MIFKKPDDQSKAKTCERVINGFFREQRQAAKLAIRALGEKLKTTSGSTINMVEQGSMKQPSFVKTVDFISAVANNRDHGND